MTEEKLKPWQTITHHHYSPDADCGCFVFLCTVAVSIGFAACVYWRGWPW